jgi:hypothetical protein
MNECQQFALKEQAFRLLSYLICSGIVTEGLPVVVLRADSHLPKQMNCYSIISYSHRIKRHKP